MASQRNSLSEKLDRVQKSIQQFPAVASSLNTATDQLAKSISQLDAVLKKFSLGIPTWVPFTPANELHSPRYYHEDIGYAKIGGKWGIAIRTVDGRLDSDLADVEQWLFPEAPRLLRMQSIEKIPELLEELITRAVEMAEKIAEKAQEVDVLTAAINSVIDPQTKPKVAQRGSAPPLTRAEEIQNVTTSATAMWSDPAYIATIEELTRAGAVSAVLGLDASVVANAASAIGVIDAIANPESVMGVAGAMANANESIFERVAGITIAKAQAGAKVRK